MTAGAQEQTWGAAQYLICDLRDTVEREGKLDLKS